MSAGRPFRGRCGSAAAGARSSSGRCCGRLNNPNSPSLSSRQSCSIPLIILVPSLDSLQQLHALPEPGPQGSSDPGGGDGEPRLPSGIPHQWHFHTPGVSPEGSLGLAEVPQNRGTAPRPASRSTPVLGRVRGKNSPRAPSSEEFMQPRACSKTPPSNTSSQWPLSCSLLGFTPLAPSALIEAEVQRRKQLIHQSVERRAIISKCYKPKHPEVYTLQDSFLAPEFLEIVRFCTSPGADLQGLLCYLESFSDKRIYRLPVFTEEFCQAFVDELENFEQSDMPKGRPNTMNNYGVLLNELGMDEPFLTPLRERFLQPITALLYPELGGACLDSHKAFVVKYSLHEDLDLSSHYDNAEVTLNVSLGKEFTEGNLYFGDFNQDPSPVPQYIEVEHVGGRGLLHRGGQIHGALPIASGERWNLIVWMRSSAIRNQLCPMCNRKPELVEAEGFGDGFTEALGGEVAQTVNLCALG
ncbi:2-oxoglutarate and iron-dependent oxygenase domain-containing protein 2 isoform 1-T1 [Cyanocitta cristata]